MATGAGSLASESGLGHINAFVVNAADGTADSVYGGDLLGNLWRVDLTTAAGSAYPAAQKIAVLTDAIGVGQPVTSRPSIEVHYTTKKRFVLVGTGRLLSTSDIASTQSQAFYAIVDGNNARFNSAADLPAGITFPIVTGRLAENTVPLGGGAPWDPATQMGWFEQLGSGAGGIGWRVTSDSATLLGSVAFAATLPNGSVCNPSGSSHIYARDFATAGSTVQSSGPGSIVPAVYVTMSGTVTDLRYLSVNGKGTLISGTDVGDGQQDQHQRHPEPRPAPPQLARAAGGRVTATAPAGPAPRRALALIRRRRGARFAEQHRRALQIALEGGHRRLGRGRVHQRGAKGRRFALVEGAHDQARIVAQRLGERVDEALRRQQRALQLVDLGA